MPMMHCGEAMLTSLGNSTAISGLLLLLMMCWGWIVKVTAVSVCTVLVATVLSTYILPLIGVNVTSDSIYAILKPSAVSR